MQVRFSVIAGFILLSLAATETFAFPELARHGYVNCITCHVSPSGGGALNDYGRTISGEGLSTWSRKDEESLFHGLVRRKKIPNWLSLGGDVRAVQVYEDTKTTTRAQSIMMQADFEAAVRYKKLTLDASYGRMQTSRTDGPKPYSRRHFIMYNFTDEIMLRAGRFLPVYGINLPDHVIATRAPLELDQGSETYNIEGSWITDSWNIVATGFQGPVDRPTVNQENGETFQVSYAFKETYKVGASVLVGRTDVRSRQLTGVHAILGFTEHLYLMSEYHMRWLRTYTPDKSTQGFFTHHRFGYEIYRGIHALLTAEQWQTDSSVALTETQRFGIGTQLFPRPHFDIQAIWTKMKARANGDDYQDYAWAVFHYYF